MKFYFEVISSLKNRIKMSMIYLIFEKIQELYLMGLKICMIVLM